MPVNKAEATWNGGLKDGDGEMELGSGAFKGAFTYRSRFEGDGENMTNPEELIGGAYAGCFSMALSADLGREGYDAERVHTEATVHMEDGSITRIELDTEATVPEVSDDEFQEIAQGAKENCPVSQALGGGVEKSLNARLSS